MRRMYRVFCSDARFLNEDLAEDAKKNWEAVNISCTKISEYDTHCCVLMKKDIISSDEEWIPEAKVWRHKL
ncbi:MAG: hypothetical protein DRM98_00070 [Thermoplasmata archaeon]|nr:MAG: hypothetical protein DRM98_00070 [Thermoplasmata archaeon]